MGRLVGLVDVEVSDPRELARPTLIHPDGTHMDEESQMFRDEINRFSERRLNRMSDDQAIAIAIACVRIALMCEKNGATDAEHLKLLDKVERCVEDPSANTLSWDDIVAYQEYRKMANTVQAHHAAWVCYGVHFEKDLPRYLSISQAISDCAGAAYLAEMAGMDMAEVKDLFKQAVAPAGVIWP